MNDRALFAAHARLPDGWRENVLLEWDADGTLTRVSPDYALAGDLASRDGGPDSARAAPLARAAGPLVAGMPNLHSHAFQRAMAGLTEHRANATDSFWSWRALMYRFAAKLTPDGIGAIARWLDIEMLKAGYTSVCEFHYLHHGPDGRPYPNVAETAERVVDAAARTGIGMTLLPVLYQFSGFGARAPNPDQRRFIHTPDSLLRALDGLRLRYPEDPMRRYGVAPHSLRAVSRDTLRELLAGLDRDFQGAPIHIHIAEQTAEVDACIATEGARPVRWLLDQFEVGPRWCLVHATHLDEHETRALAHTGATAGLCLTTEANLGDGLFPALDYVNAGGRFGIGSDSHIAVDWRAELRLLEYGQRLARRERNVLASRAQPAVADHLFDAAAHGGAQATGRAVGSIAVGRRADWIVLDPDHPNLAERPPSMWLSGAVFGEHGASPVRDVYVGGQRRVERGRHAQEEEAFADYRRVLRELLAD
ncbi:formimidoylglutamate deiminase [Pararobbsia silviterrae]|uniref:Formimidoylglutamate deiminase n=1 Tax=Pararobbsia silviterrae TaxID=1792498 RepID=A0A494Y8J1_9BURK|nr:formimidoylglutamate deiminase [Pararobbsia silviterrae]RKP59002.1 formimidoylglutamate deiminase [Pararobbsia silviterrae]